MYIPFSHFFTHEHILELGCIFFLFRITFSVGIADTRNSPVTILFPQRKCKFKKGKGAERESQIWRNKKIYTRKREVRLTQRKVNHVYFWDSIAWALAVHLIILQPVICAHSQWVTAAICWSVFAFSITVQLCLILMCSLFHSPLVNLIPAFVYEMVNEANPTSLQILMYFLSSGPAIFPRTQSLAKGLASMALTAPALPKVWPQEIYSSSRSIYDSSISNTRVQTNAVFLEPSVSLSTNLFDHVWFATCMLE